MGASQAKLVAKCQADAQGLIHKSDFVAAVESLTRALNHDPHNRSVLADLQAAQDLHRDVSAQVKQSAEEAFLGKDYRQAIDQFKRALDLLPDDCEIAAGLASATSMAKSQSVRLRNEG